MLACRTFADVNRDTQAVTTTHNAWRIADESPPLVSPRHARVDSDHRDFAGLWHGAGAIAGTRAWGIPTACRIDETRRAAHGDAGRSHSFAHPAYSTRCRRDTCGTTCRGARAGADRRSVWRADHARTEDGRRPQGQRQLGFGVR